MRDDGEALSRGQLDRRTVEATALRDALLGAALFSGVVLVNGVLAIVFIVLMQALGLWGPAPSEATSSVISDEMRSSLDALTGRTPTPGSIG